MKVEKQQQQQQKKTIKISQVLYDLNRLHDSSENKIKKEMFTILYNKCSEKHKL